MATVLGCPKNARRVAGSTCGGRLADALAQVSDEPGESRVALLVPADQVGCLDLSERHWRLYQVEEHGTSFRRFHASSASARTQSECTEVLVHTTTTQLAASSSRSITVAKASPVEMR